MSTGSAIEWTDATWNPTLGCTRVSAGCENCYAEKLAARLEAMGRADYAGLTRKHGDGSVNWTGEVRTLQDRIADPMRWKKPRRVFVNSMSDLFHEVVPFEFIDQVFATMALARRHTFQVLTKRPARMLEYLTSVQLSDTSMAPWVNSWPAFPAPNVWLGVSVENQAAADERIPLLLQTPAAVRFLSCEPLLGPVDLRGWETYDHGCFTIPGEVVPRIDWVIAGGESGGPIERRLVTHLGAQGEVWTPRRWGDPDCLQWVRDLRDQCQAAGVPFFFKQWGGPTPKSGGRLLDGRTWDEFPDTKGATS